MRKLLFTLILATFLSACSEQRALTRLGVPITNVKVSLIQGDIRLECEIACSGSYGSIRSELKRLYEGGLWLDLAVKVVNNGFKKDQAYFYLGRAAEELGAIDSAIQYYKLAKVSLPPCGGTINTCDGFSFPADIDYRLEKIRILKETEHKEFHDKFYKDSPATISNDVFHSQSSSNDKNLNRRIESELPEKTQKKLKKPFKSKTTITEKNSLQIVNKNENKTIPEPEDASTNDKNTIKDNVEEKELKKKEPIRIKSFLEL